jgi:triacylglycerol esterase/lipase EstA (alpha/beta hydrolase family)
MSVITVDWGSGAGFPYSRAAANTRVVGAQLGMLVKTLHEKLGLDVDKVHLIGHSLGAHIAGYVSQFCDACRAVGRVTGRYV